MNDFPDEHLYTLLADAEPVTSFDDWPDIWIRETDDTIDHNSTSETEANEFPNQAYDWPRVSIGSYYPEKNLREVVIAPRYLFDTFLRARCLAGHQSPTLEQAVLADFISEGHFARHIRRMRVLYAE